MRSSDPIALPAFVAGPLCFPEYRGIAVGIQSLILLAIILTMLYGGNSLVPQINRARDAGPEAHGRFTRLHRRSVLLNGAAMVGGMGLLVAFACRQAPRTEGIIELSPIERARRAAGVGARRGADLGRGCVPGSGGREELIETGGPQSALRRLGRARWSGDPLSASTGTRRAVPPGTQPTMTADPQSHGTRTRPRDTQAESIRPAPGGPRAILPRRRRLARESGPRFPGEHARDRGPGPRRPARQAGDPHRRRHDRAVGESRDGGADPDRARPGRDGEYRRRDRRGHGRHAALHRPAIQRSGHAAGRHRSPRDRGRPERRPLQRHPHPSRRDQHDDHGLPARAAGDGDAFAGHGLTVRHRVGDHGIPARGQQPRRRRPDLALPPRRQGPAGPDPQSEAPPEPFRHVPECPGERVPLRQADLQLVRRA